MSLKRLLARLLIIVVILAAGASAQRVAWAGRETPQAETNSAQVGMKQSAPLETLHTPNQPHSPTAVKLVSVGADSPDEPLLPLGALGLGVLTMTCASAFAVLRMRSLHVLHLTKPIPANNAISTTLPTDQPTR